MTAARVEILIDELVLHGFRPGDRHAIGAALSQELERLVRAGDVSALGGLGSLESMRTPDLTLAPGARPAAVGAQVARAVHASFGSHGRGGSK